MAYGGRKKENAGRKKVGTGKKNGRETEKSFSGRSCLFCCDVGEAGWGMVYVTSGRNVARVKTNCSNSRQFTMARVVPSQSSASISTEAP